MNIWSNDEINQILMELNNRQLPFYKYQFTCEDNSFKVLGKGAFSTVYEAESKRNAQNKYAVKVIGFGDYNSDSRMFNEAVSAQKQIGDYNADVVKIYDSAELYIYFSETDEIVDVKIDGTGTNSDRCLKLQFILMEKVLPVIYRDNKGQFHTNPESLMNGDEQEIIKLARTIGGVLHRAHENNILHRDVKLENVFYSEKKGQYKLGDFGIAKITDDGFASTIAFTTGYAAPEIRGAARSNRYDNTADIYSFGIMLYVLLNGLKFPGSEGYFVNSDIQYQKDYVIKKPINGSQELYEVIKKLCDYDPDRRYQDIEEALQDIDDIKYSAPVGYMRANRKAELYIGAILLVMGAAVWQMTIYSDVIVSYSWKEYVFIILSFANMFFHIKKRKTTIINVFLVPFALYLIVSTGITWWKILLFIGTVIFSGLSAGIIAGVMLVVNLVSISQRYGISWLMNDNSFSWIAVFLCSFAVALIYRYLFLDMNEEWVAKLLSKKGHYWIWVMIIYAIIMTWGFVLINSNYPADLASHSSAGYINDYIIRNDINLFDVGLSGIILSLLALMRDRVLIKRHNDSTNMN